MLLLFFAISIADGILLSCLSFFHFHESILANSSVVPITDEWLNSNEDFELKTRPLNISIPYTGYSMYHSLLCQTKGFSLTCVGENLVA